MTINLTKGQTINLDKKTSDLSSVTIGLGWKIKKKGGLLKRLVQSSDEYDLDAIAFMLDADEKIINLGTNKLSGGDVVFFGNLKHPSGHLYHTGDNLVGGAGVEDDEQIVVKLDSLDARYCKIVFLVCIYQGKQKGQHFGEVDGAFIRAVDGKGTELARFRLGDNSTYKDKRTIVFGEVYRKDGDWKFRALGDAYPEDSFVELLRRHVR